jgi:DNA-binding beta-propeller fold protein YncE
VIATVAGNRAQVFSGDNGPATSAQLNEPQGVAVDAAGNLCIADTDNNRLRKVSSGIIATVAGSGTAGFSGDNGTGIGAWHTVQPVPIRVDQVFGCSPAATSRR